MWLVVAGCVWCCGLGLDFKIHRNLLHRDRCTARNNLSGFTSHIVIHYCALAYRSICCVALFTNQFVLCSSTRIKNAWFLGAISSEKLIALKSLVGQSL